MATLPTRLAAKWPEFYSKIEAMFENEEEQEICIDNFKKLCEEYSISISDSEQNAFLEAFPGKIDGAAKYIDMTHLVELQKASQTNSLYKKADLSDDDTEMGDFSGYTGYRQYSSKFLEAMAYDQFIDLFVAEDKLPAIIRSIKDIDSDNNGYVTTTELEDILKVHYPVLKDKTIKKLFKPFASIQNRILIDYVSLTSSISFGIESV